MGNRDVDSHKNKSRYFITPHHASPGMTIIQINRRTTPLKRDKAIYLIFIIIHYRICHM